MKPVSWRHIQSWSCIECGMCCKDYKVVLSVDEYVNIVKTYGFEAGYSQRNRLQIAKKGDNTCYFLTPLGSSCVCGLQYKKPKACKIWPFKVFATPKFGMAEQALYRYKNRDLYIYVDMACSGLTFGTPTDDFKYRVLPEFIEVAADLRDTQIHSTSKINVNSSRVDVKKVDFKDKTG